MLEAFKLKDLQHLNFLLQHFEAHGVTNIADIRGRIENKIHQTRLDSSRIAVAAKRNKKNRVKQVFTAPVINSHPDKCPSCDRGVMQKMQDKYAQGLDVMWCKSCSYSEVR